MQKPVPGSKNYNKRYMKWWKKQDRKQRGEMTLWELIKAVFGK